MDIKYVSRLESAWDAKRLIERIGFIPLFQAEGAAEFSIEALTRGQWWTGMDDDPWYWREVLSEDPDIVYGKFFSGRAGFIHKDWLPVFANFRRDGYDFDSREEEGLVGKKLSDIMKVVFREGRILSSTLKKETGANGYDGAITSLQMQTYLIIDSFGRRVNKKGEMYGWNIAYLAAPEMKYGYDFVTQCYSESPVESYEKIRRRIAEICPEATNGELSNVIGAIRAN